MTEDADSPAGRDESPVDLSLTRELEAAMLGDSADDSAGDYKAEPDPAPAAVDLTGVTLDNLLVQRRIGEGGMGAVWLARDVELDIQVAVKVLQPEIASDQQFVMRFLREARAVARLDHPNIVRVLQAGRREHNGEYLRVMVTEFVEGRDAYEALNTAEQGRLPTVLAARIALGAARALRFAHSKGVIHRDIKPHNLLLKAHRGSDGQVEADVEVKVLDFGLAQLSVPEKQQLTQTDVIMGTPQYMSPEQAQGKPTDHRTDIYSLGATLYHLLSGRLPHPGESAFTMIEGHVRHELEFPEDAFTEVPGELRTLIQAMCAKAPDDRATLDQVITHLEQYLGLTPKTAALTTVAPTKGRTNLSPLPTSFVGRQAEMAELRQRLADGARLVTVLGPGGIGKTRFTREYGLTAVDDYPGGVWFCDLTEARSAEGICQGVGRGLGVPLTEADPTVQIHSALRMRGKLLVILDNFEQVTQHAAETLGKWMQDTPHVQFIASSREPLHLQGEAAYPLDPLNSGSAGDDAGVQLFADRARDARRNFELDAGNTEAVRKIVNELDGIPLAIELAAARVSALSPQKILERLPKRFELLTSRRRDASERQLTMLGAIEWSWNLLAPYEQLALAQCSVFRDGFFLEAAEAVIDLSTFPDAPLSMDVVETLVEKSLLRAYEVPQLPGETRYRMYESIRQFADRKMADADLGGTRQVDASALRVRHGSHFAEYGEYWAERTASPEGLEALNRLALEVENLLSVQDALQQAEPVPAARAILAANAVLTVRGPWSGRIERIERALAALPIDEALKGTDLLIALARAHFDCGSSEGLKRAVDDAIARSSVLPDEPESTKRKAKALSMRGLASWRVGDYDVALSSCAEAEAMSREIGDRAGISAAVAYRGLIQNERGEYDAALASFLEVEAIRRELGDREGIATIVGNRGAIYRTRDDFDAAMACYAEAEAIHRELGDRSGIARNIGQRGIIYKVLDQHDTALACYTEAEAIQREIGDRAGLIRNVVNRGILHNLRGEYDAALACHTEADAISRELGARPLIAGIAAHIGAVHACRQEHELALARYAEAEAIHRELGNRAGLAFAIANRGICLEDMGKLEEAAAALSESQAIRTELGAGSLGDQFLVLIKLTRIYRDLSRSADTAVSKDHAAAALDSARQANEIAKKLNFTPDHQKENVRKALSLISEILTSGSDAAADPAG